MVLLLVFDTETSIVYVTYFYIRTKFYFDYLKSILGGTFITIINDITQIMLFFTVRSHIISHQISFYLFLRRLKFFWMFFLLVCVSPCLDNVELCTLKKNLFALFFNTKVQSNGQFSLQPWQFFSSAFHCLQWLYWKIELMIPEQNELIR